MKLAAVAFAVLSAASISACAAPDPALDPAVSGTAEQAWCSGLYVTQVAARAGTVFFVSPATLATATDGWGPQALSLSVAQAFSTQVTHTRTPGLSLATDDVTRSLSNALGFSVTSSVTLIAATTVLVPTDAYYRLEAYPEYQVIDWSLRADRCGLLPDTLVMVGTVYRPVGVHFRALTLVGSEWSAVNPPSPAQISFAPPWAPGSPSAAALPPAAGNAAAPSAAGTPPAPAAPGGAAPPAAPGGAVSPATASGATAPAAGGAAASTGAASTAAAGAP